MAHEEIIRRAVELVKAGRKVEARALLSDVLRQDPTHIGALSAMARASDNDEEAIAALQRVLEVDPDDEWAQRHLARLQRGSRGEMDEHPSTKRSPVKDDWVTAGDAPPSEKPSPPNTLADPAESWQGVGWQQAKPPQSEHPPESVASPAPAPPAAPSTSAPGTTGPLATDEPPPPNRRWLFIGGGCLMLTVCVCVTLTIAAVLFGDVGQGIAENIIEDQLGEFGVGEGAVPGNETPLPSPAIGEETPTALLETPLPPTEEAADPVSDFDDDLTTALTEPITLAETTEAVLEGPAEAHNWLFDVNEGDQFIISVTALDDDELDPRISVYGEDGTLLAFDDDGGEGFNSRVSINVQPGQTLTLRVSAFSGTGGYTITVEAAN